VGVDHLEEALIKSKLLGLSSVRTVVFDSSKLLKEEISAVFAPLDRSNIDIVVVDEGSPQPKRSAMEWTRGFTSFCEKAIQFDVIPLVVKTGFHDDEFAPRIRWKAYKTLS
jgi:hypothetical protein